MVFLDVGVADAARRIGLNRDRPLLVGNPRAQWVRQMEARRGVYEQVSTVRVLTDGLDPAAVARAVLDALGPLPVPGLRAESLPGREQGGGEPGPEPGLPGGPRR